MSQDDQETTASGKEKRKGALRGVYRDMGVLGSVRSLGNNAKQGADTIALGLETVVRATRKSLEPGRHETFYQATLRLGIEPEDLPIIHNQIALQLYLTLVVAAAALIGAGIYFLNGQIMAPLISLVVSLTCFAKAAQSSIQCMSIRQKRLGVAGDWISSPGEWMPKRIIADKPMEKNDPLRDPSVIQTIARTARRSLSIGALLILLAVCWVFLFPGNQWSLLYLGAGLVMIFTGAKSSFEVFKRRKGIHCDVIPWLSDPSEWFPELEGNLSATRHAQTSSEDFRARGFLSSEEMFNASVEKDQQKD